MLDTCDRLPFLLVSPCSVYVCTATSCCGRADGWTGWLVGTGTHLYKHSDNDITHVLICVPFECISYLGDVTPDGKKIGERPGHFNDDNKPKGFNTKKVFLSPSIHYAGHNTYATPSR